MSEQTPHDDLLDDLLALADGLGVEIRRSPMGGEAGGLAVLRGREILFVDTDAPREVQIEKSAAGLARLGERLEAVYIRPALRALLGIEGE